LVVDMAFEKIEVRLPTELLNFARMQIDGQNFNCIDGVIAEALSRFSSSIEAEKAQNEWLKEEIQKGIDSADRGECVDGPKFIERLIARVPD